VNDQIDPGKHFVWDDEHQDCVSKDDVVDYAIRSHWPEIELAVRRKQAEVWKSTNQVWLNVLDAALEYDHRVHRLDFQKRLTAEYIWDLEGWNDEVVDDEEGLLDVAGKVCAILEEERRKEKYQAENIPFDLVPPVCAYEDKCQLEDLSWVRGLLGVSRMFRQLLVSTAEAEAEHLIYYLLTKESGECLQKLDALDRKSLETSFLLHQGEIERIVDADKTPLELFLAHLICEYLSHHKSSLKLASCVECNRIFARERRDNSYCSKTCQNRVAYKRKRILASGVLREIEMNAQMIDLVQPGLWIYDPRLALGVVEDLHFRRRSLEVSGPEGNFIASVILPENANPAKFFEEKQRVPGSPIHVEGATWKEVCDPSSATARVRFLSLVKSFNVNKLLDEKGGKGRIFYTVEDQKRLAQML
jgi:hypothetical protein